MSRTSVIISFLVVLFSFINTEEFSDTLEPFQQIRVCVPYTVKVQAASEPGTYRIDVDADQAVYDALKKNVNSEGELSLSSHGDFESQNPIKVTVVVPSQELTVVTTQGFSDVLIAGEFEVDNLTVVSGGPNAIFGDKLTVREFLQVKNSGVGDVVLGGSLEGEIDVVLAGIAEVFLKGVSGNVVLDGRGISMLGVEGSKDEVSITGTVSDMGKVQYTQGQCSVQSSGLFFIDPCQSVSELAIPQKSTQFYWSCGIKVKGNSTCSSLDSGPSSIFHHSPYTTSQTSTSGAGASASASASTFAQGTSIFSSAGPSLNGQMSSSTSSSGPNGVTTVDVSGTEGARGSAVALSKQECSVEEGDLLVES
eukprot:TRINITY_DN7661_c0_g3_i3.p1 TRINITY_DN7661_c0_g3~~TRINITY_DN7661_c0_g3_i3.p1  ORF type:complete len:365 (-),score=67.27 TRINITY_DN7661_c0_g3_i3:333-1427(-)